MHYFLCLCSSFNHKYISQIYEYGFISFCIQTLHKKTNCCFALFCIVKRLVDFIKKYLIHRTRIMM